MIEQRTVLTIATGKKIYVDMAVNLALSFLWWHKNSDIRFSLFTDQPQFIPAALNSKIQVQVIQPGELGEGFSSKLHLDKLAGEGQTLFIDSDCLIFGDLSPVFEKFRGMPVSVLGGYISSGEWFGDVAAICKKFNVPHLPKFNGGIYYLEKGETANKVYHNARQLEKQYDDIGFVRLRNRPNDEVIMALAIQLEGLTPLIDDGNTMSDPQACQGRLKMDILKGKTKMTNPSPPSKLHQSWYPFHVVRPVIIHFLGAHTQEAAYKKEVYRLNEAIKNNRSLLVDFYGAIRFTLPEKVQSGIKNTLRPLFHTLFGTRRIKNSPRL